MKSCGGGRRPVGGNDVPSPPVFALSAAKRTELEKFCLGIRLEEEAQIADVCCRNTAEIVGFRVAQMDVCH